MIWFLHNFPTLFGAVPTATFYTLLSTTHLNIKINIYLSICRWGYQIFVYGLILDVSYERNIYH
jgi:hypothetical protein